VALLGVPLIKRDLGATKITVDSRSSEADGNAAHAASNRIHSGNVFSASVGTKSAGVAPLRTAQALPIIAALVVVESLLGHSTFLLDLSNSIEQTERISSFIEDPLKSKTKKRRRGPGSLVK
jgi:hypothetical protein